MNRAFLPVAIVAAALAAWAFVGGNDEPPPLRGATGDQAAAAGPSDAVNTGLDGPPAAAEAAAAARDAVAGERANDAPELPADAAELVVRVIAGEPPTPVPGAVVRWTDATSHHEVERRQLGEFGTALQADQEALAERFGWRTLSDSEGLARVRTGGEWLRVVARDGERYGELVVNRHALPPRGGYEVRLTPDRVLTVRVLDHRGAPQAGVPVAIAAHRQDGGFDEFLDQHPAAHTGDDGLAQLRHLQRLDKALGKRTARVTTNLPGHNDPGVAFDLQAPPKEPVTLRLPPCGEVLVRAEVFGRPLTGPHQYSLTLPSEQPRDRNVRRLLIGDGQAAVRFPFVPLGKRLRAQTQDLWTELTEEFAGPMQPDQVVEVVLRASAEQCAVVGRVLGPDGAPLANQELLLQMAGSRWPTSNQLRTDAAGRFQVCLHPEFGRSGVTALLLDWQRKPLPSLRAEIPLGGVSGGRRDVGDVQVGEPPLFVGGRFEWEGGEAPKSIPRIERWQRDGDEPTRWTRVRDPWLFHRDEQGRFSFRGRHTPGRYRLVATGALPVTPVEFRPGDADVVLRVTTGSRLAATLLMPTDAWPPLVPQLVPGDGQPGVVSPEKHWDGHLNLVDGRGEVLWSAVPPGTYTLRVMWYQTPWAVTTIPAVQVPPPPGGDPRLVDIDLRSLLRVVQLDLRTPARPPGQTGNDNVQQRYFRSDSRELTGALFPTGQVEQDLWYGWPVDGNRDKVVLPADRRDFWLAIRGYRPQQVAVTGDQLQVDLQPWPTVALTFPGLPELPPKATLQVRVAPEQPMGRYQAHWRDGDRADLFGTLNRSATVQNGRAEVPVGDGAHRLTLQLTGNRRAIPIEGLTPARILPNDGAVAVAVPADVWQPAFAKFQAPAK